MKALDTMKKATVKGCGQGWEDPLTGRTPRLSSCEKTHTKRERRERPNDNHRSGKFILLLWGCLDREEQISPATQTFPRGTKDWHSHHGPGDT